MNYLLLTTLLTIALIDSLNPSAIAMTVIQLSSKTNPILRSLFYILGIFTTYFLLGVILLILYLAFGSSFSIDFSSITNFVLKPPTWTYYLQFILGLVIIVYSLFYFRQNSQKQKQQDLATKQPKDSLIGSFFLGVTITGVESATALPYFGAISTLYYANLGFFRSLILLIVYNLVFVLPPLIIVLIYKFNSRNFSNITGKIKNLISKYSYTVLKVGFVLLGLYLSLESFFYLINGQN